MKIIDVEQGSEAWHKCKLGIPSASNFSKIMTLGLIFSKSSDEYLHKLLGEWVLGQPNDTYVSPFMQRGIELEPKAVEYYELIKGVETTKVGFCLMDNGLVGCSPDRLINVGDGYSPFPTFTGLEIKVPEVGTHIGYMAEPESLKKKYKSQVQGSLYVTDAGHWDLMSYNPELPQVLIRCYRDEEHIKALGEAMDKFLARMEELKDKLKALGVKEFVEETEDYKEFNKIFPEEN